MGFIQHLPLFLYNSLDGTEPLSAALEFRTGNYFNLGRQKQTAQGAIGFYRSLMGGERRVGEHNEEVNIAILVGLSVSVGAIKINLFRA
jgi:hypothetical protein